MKGRVSGSSLLRRSLAVTGAVLCGACATQVAPLHTSPSAIPIQAAETAVVAPNPLSTQEIRDYRGARASSLVGAQVIDNRAQYLGRLQEILVDTRTGFVRHAVVSSAHPARERLLRVPVRLLGMTDEAAVVLDADSGRLAEQSYIVPPDGTPGIHGVSRLIGKRVDDHSGRQLGRITDVVIDLSRQKVHYVALRFDRQSGFPTELAFAVPIEALIVRGAGPERIALAVPRDRLAGLIGFDAGLWPELDDPRYLSRMDRSFGTLLPRESGAVGATR